MRDRLDALVVVLDGRHTDRRPLGGKAAALDRLIEFGLRVPRSAVLTTVAYRAAVADGPLRCLIDRLCASPIPEPADHAAARQAIDEAFLTAPLPTAVTWAIAELADLVTQATTSRLALRSSATAEDLGSASFAGQYRSVLDVEPAGVERAVRLTWASLWHPAPRTYRAFRGLGDDIEMAVLAMAMVDPVTAGVLFTRDPAGDTGDVRIESVAGLGEALVSGARTPDVHVLPRPTAIADARRIDPAFGELVQRCLDLEDRLGSPQDVEWAIDRDHTLWFLQARPITSLRATDDDALDDGFDHRPAGGATLTTAGIAEMLPGVLPPLTWEAGSRQVEDGFRVLFAGLGAPLDGLDPPHALVARIRGRAALDLDRLRDAAASIPGGSADELERRYFGEVLSTDATETPPARAGPLQGVRLLLDRHRAVIESEIVIDAVDDLLRPEPDLRDLTDDGLLALRSRLHDLAARTAAAEITVAALAAAAYRGVESLLTDHLGEEAAALAQMATRPASLAGRCATTLDLDRLGSEWMQRCRALGVLDLDWDDARRVLASSSGGDALLDEWCSVLRHSGSTAVFGGPTWADAPELAWLSLRARASATPDAPGGPATARRGVDAAMRAVRAAPGGRRIGPVRRRFLRRELADARELLDRRERTKAALLVLGGIARRTDDEIGRRLAERYQIEDADDVRLLSARELRAVAGGAAPTLDAVARRRRRLAAATAAGPLPRLFRGVPSATITPPAFTHGEPGVHLGWGASPGWYEGPARIVTTPSTRSIRRGEVLVARTTDASWAPLFLLAGAIVVEEGGPLSHAAIIARELGAPAVVNLPGIVDAVAAAVADGGAAVRIAVDGTAGTVRLGIARHEPTPEALGPAEPPARPDDLHLVPVRTAPVGPDLNRLGVFITGLIGAGAALSAVVTIAETIGSDRGVRRTRRRGAAAGANAAMVVRRGTAHATDTPIGLRTRRWYGVAAGAMVALTAAVVVLGVRQLVEHPAGDAGGLWLAAALASAVPLAAASLVTARAAIAWPAVPAPVRRHLPDTRTARVDVWRAMPGLHRRTITALASIVAVLLTLAVTAEAVLLAVDRPLYDGMGANQYADPWAPEWFGMYFGRPQVVIPAALLVAIFTVRCRVLALAYPLAIVFGGITNMGIGHLVGRQRPPLSNHANQTDSFPSGHAIEVTLLFGLAPLAIAVLLQSPWAGRIARVIATVALAVMLADGVRDGSHWLSDHVAGFAIALAAVVFVHALARIPELHERCHDCPALALHRERPS